MLTKRSYEKCCGVLCSAEKSTKDTNIYIKMLQREFLSQLLMIFMI